MLLLCFRSDCTILGVSARIPSTALAAGISSFHPGSPDLHCWYPRPQPGSAFWIRKLNVKLINLKTYRKGQVAFLMSETPVPIWLTVRNSRRGVIRNSCKCSLAHPPTALLHTAFPCKMPSQHKAQLASRYLCSHTDYATSVFFLWGIYLLAVRSHLVKVYCT